MTASTKSSSTTPHPDARISRYYRERLMSGNITPEERGIHQAEAAQRLIESIEQRRIG
jgi:hypothetical protein